MNWNLFLFFVAVGATSELLTLKHPTPGERYAAVIGAIGGGLLAAVVIPPAANSAVYAGLFIASFGRVLGSSISKPIDKFRIYIDARMENAKTTSGKRP